MKNEDGKGRRKGERMKKREEKEEGKRNEAYTYISTGPVSNAFDVRRAEKNRSQFQGCQV